MALAGNKATPLIGQPYHKNNSSSLSYPALFINKKLCIAETFSIVLTNLPKQKLEIINLNNLSKNV